jgi:hypothetical protein
VEEEIAKPERFWEAFDAKICFDVALGVFDIPELLERHNLTAPELQHMFALPAFKAQVTAYKRYIRDEGLSFKEKAKIMAEELLGTTYDLIHHVHTPAAEKVKLIALINKLAGNEPTPSQQDATGNFLPAVEARLKAIPDEELEIQVIRIVQKRKERERTVDGEVLLPVTLQ